MLPSSGATPVPRVVSIVVGIQCLAGQRFLVQSLVKIREVEKLEPVTAPNSTKYKYYMVDSWNQQ